MCFTGGYINTPMGLGRYQGSGGGVIEGEWSIHYFINTGAGRERGMDGKRVRKEVEMVRERSLIQ